MAVLGKNAMSILEEVYVKNSGGEKPKYEVSQARARSKKEAERAAAGKAVWELRQRQGIVWPDDAFISTSAYKPGEPLPPSLASLAGKAVTLTEEFIRTLSSEQVAMIQQLA